MKLKIHARDIKHERSMTVIADEVLLLKGTHTIMQVLKKKDSQEYQEFSYENIDLDDAKFIRITPWEEDK